MREIETGTSQFVLRDDGIVQQTAKPGLKQELADAKENMKAFFELAGGQKRLLLVDLRKTGPTGSGVREYYAEHSVHLHATAMVIEGALSEMIGNFFIRLNRPAAPTKLFTSEPAAVAWLLTHAPR
jgi:hypothetical protein